MCMALLIVCSKAAPKVVVVQVIVISFTLIISLMLGTFAFVLKVGAIRIND